MLRTPHASPCNPPSHPLPRLPVNLQHVVFGEVVEGMEVVKAIENAATDRRDRPIEPVVIANCGEV